MSGSRFSDFPLAGTLAGLEIAGLQGGLNVRLPSSVLAAYLLARIDALSVDTPDLALTDSVALSAAHYGQLGLFLGANAKVLTLPSLTGGTFRNGQAFFYQRAPGSLGAVQIVGLTAGGISHPLDHAAIDLGGPIALIARIGRTAVNGGAPYWELMGWTLLS